MTNPHRFETVVYYEDTDAGGVVYYANYLKFAERARTEFLRSVGILQSRMWEDHGIGFVVGECHIKYLRPATLDDKLVIETTLQELGQVRMTMQQTVRCETVELARIVCEIACVDTDFKPTRIPDFIRGAVQPA